MAMGLISRQKYYGYLEKLPIRQISALCEKFRPRNINYMPTAKFLACLDLE